MMNRDKLPGVGCLYRRRSSHRLYFILLSQWNDETASFDYLIEAMSPDGDTRSWCFERYYDWETYWELVSM
jgi:hypothetical protein